jgi:hypothetical protein
MQRHAWRAARQRSPIFEIADDWPACGSQLDANLVGAALVRFDLELGTAAIVGAAQQPPLQVSRPAIDRRTTQLAFLITWGWMDHGEVLLVDGVVLEQRRQSGSRSA